MTHRSRLCAALFCLSLAAASCNDSPSDPAQDALTNAEIDALVEALVSVATLDPDLDPGASALAGAAPTVVTFPIDETMSCARGGTIRATGTVTVTVEEDDRGTYLHEIAQDFQACRSRSTTLQADFVFHGDPSVVSRVEASIASDGTLTAFEGSETGALRWEYGGRSGRCAIDLDYALSPTVPTTPVLVVSGTACGRTVTRQVPPAG